MWLARCTFEYIHFYLITEVKSRASTSINKNNVSALAELVRNIADMGIIPIYSTERRMSWLLGWHIQSSCSISLRWESSVAHFIFATLKHWNFTHRLAGEISSCLVLAAKLNHSRDAERASMEYQTENKTLTWTYTCNGTYYFSPNT